MELILAILLGGFFGFALNYVGATNTTKLKNMLTLRDLTIMKIILFAIGFSSLLVAAASFMGIFDISHLSVKTTHLGVVVGGLIFGVGFGWAGTCPGTCVAGAGGLILRKPYSLSLVLCLAHLRTHSPMEPLKKQVCLKR